MTTATPVVLDRYEKPGNLAAIASLASSGQIAIRAHELIRTTDGRVYHWTGTAVEIVSAPVHHGTVATAADLAGIYLLPTCTRGVHSGDTAYVTAAGCEYRVLSGVNATAVWARCTTAPTPTPTTDDVSEGSRLYYTDARADARISAHKGVPGGIPGLGPDGKMLLAYLPAVAVVDCVGNASSEAQMLALVGQRGDWCARTDLGTTWQLVGDDPTQLSSWMQHLYPASPVQSVHGRKGAVSGQFGDYYNIYEPVLGSPPSDGYHLAGTAAGGRSWVAPYSHPATHAQSIVDSASGWITEALNGKQAAGNYLTTTGTAADSARLGGIAAGGYSVAGHTHNYAGSTTPGGDASRALYCTNPQFSGDVVEVEDISQRTHSGIYQGDPGAVTTARGWPINGEWTNLIAATHSNTGNYYSMQFAGLFSYQRFFARNTNGAGAQGWAELIHSGNYTSLIGDGSLGIAKINGLSDALSTRAVTAGSADFGGSTGSWTTADFIAGLTAKGAFNTSQWSIRGSWSYASNKIITDTGCGDIELAGATVEVFRGTPNEYMVRVTTSPLTSTGYYPKTVFIYQNHGDSYAPGWRRMLNNDSMAFDNLAGTGVPVRTATNTWEFISGKTTSVVVGGTTLNFVNGLLVSYLST